MHKRIGGYRIIRCPSIDILDWTLEALLIIGVAMNIDRGRSISEDGSTCSNYCK